MSMHLTARLSRFLLGLVVIALAGCGGPSGTEGQAAPAGTAAARHEQARLDRLRAENRQLQRKLERRRVVAAQSGREDEGPAVTGGAEAGSFTALERKLGGSSGVAVSGAAYGSLTTGPAWSTMKVPVAIAALVNGTAADADLRAAITASDNAAAERLWSTLGTPAEAGRKTQSVLGDGTQVQTTVTRPGFSSFGQTDWPLADQQRFVASLPCSSAAAPVLELMGQTVADQRWGLASTGQSAAVKGGWGPGTDGRYLVRQMGILRFPDGGAIAAAMATIPADGSFASGTSNLNAIAQWVTAHVKPARLAC